MKQSIQMHRRYFSEIIQKIIDPTNFLALTIKYLFKGPCLNLELVEAYFYQRIERLPGRRRWKKVNEIEEWAKTWIGNLLCFTHRTAISRNSHFVLTRPIFQRMECSIYSSTL